MTKRDCRLDILRVIAVLMIVLMHSPQPYSAPGYVLSGINYLSAPGIGLFFMISGALLLGNQLAIKDFLKRRFSKILFPTFFWTLFYLLVESMTAKTSIAVFLKSIINFPFAVQGCGVLWFMYTLAGLYLLTPILSQWLRNVSKKEVEFYLLLWWVTLVYPYLGLWLHINDSVSGILYYFSGYVGYFILGYYLMRYYEFRLWHVVGAIAVAVIVPLILYSSGIEFDFCSLLWYLSLPVAMMAFVVFVLVMRIPNQQMSIVGKISTLSFGIYFIHFFLIRRIIWNLDVIDNLPGLVQTPVITMSSFILSLLFSWLVSKCPFSKYVIGC